MSSTDYRRKSTSSREDPRLAARRESTSIYDDLEAKRKEESPQTASRDPRIRDDGGAWRGHDAYNQQQQQPPMQTAYQHLPATMYPDQYTQGYQGGYPGYQQNYNATYQYPGYGQGGYGLTGTEYPHSQGWVPATGYSAPPPPQPQQQQQPQPQQMTSGVNSHVSEEKKDGVAQEIKHQKTQLIKQREEYVKKIKVLRRELEALRKQEREFLSEKSPERDTEHILIENNKLQTEIRNKLKALAEVVEMLSSLIRDNQCLDDLERNCTTDSPSSRSRDKNNHHHNHHHHRKSTSTERFDETTRCNYVHYDPELHWCRTCDVFPKTAKDLLLHLQSEDHRKVAQERGMKDDTPWHHLPQEPELPCFEGAPKKRLPIKGLQFFIPAPAWYCKLCDTWIGDLHCASQHLKSQTHSQNYSHFVDQNPHWEIEWLKDREKALARTKHASSDSEDISERKRKKHKDKHLDNTAKDKKKRKRSSKKRRKHSTDSSSSSSSSSDSSSEDDDDDDDEGEDKTRSIRVAMRNVKVQQIINEDLGGKWEMLGRLVEDRKQKERETNSENQQEDRLINQWMTVSEPKENDKQLLDGLKDRMKQKHEAEKVRQAELERKQKERELKEQEERERREREEREVKEREERDRKERERQELERIRDKERERVKLKTREREKYRKDSESGRDYDGRSPSVERKRSKHSRENGRDRRHTSPSPNKHDKKPPPPPSYKKFPFIGRMPLFKNKKPEEKAEKEIKKEDYDIPRQTRFEPGHLSRAFIPEPEVVCFPKLSSIPPLSMPPMQPPEPPKISEVKQQQQPPKAPPPPKIGDNEQQGGGKGEGEKSAKKQEATNSDYGGYHMMMDASQMAQQYYDYSMMYQQQQQQQQYDYQDIPLDEVPPEISGEVAPLQPPPLPPDDPSDDLAMLGISADDMAAQSF